MPVTVVPTSFATVAIDTFITELSSVIRNCPAASVSRTSPAPAARADGAAVVASEATGPSLARAQDVVVTRNGGLEQRGDRSQRLSPRALSETGQATARPGHGDRRRGEALLELRCDGLGADEQIDLEEPLQAPRLEVAGAGEQLPSVPDERLRVEETHADAAPCSVLDAPDHPAVGDVRVHDVERLARLLEQALNRVGDRPVSARCVVQHAGG